MPDNMFYKIWLSDSGGEAVWESHLCCFGLAVSSFEPRAAPCAGAGSCSRGPWSAVPPELGKELSYSSPLTNASGSTAQAEQIQCVMKTLVPPGSHTACFPFPVLWRILSSVSVDGHVKLQHFGHWPEWCELHVQSCDCVEEWNLVPVMRLESWVTFSQLLVSIVYLPVLLLCPFCQQKLLECPAPLSRNYFESSVSSSVRILLLNSEFTSTRGMSLYVEIVLSTR